MSVTKIFLLFNNEDIEQYKHEHIIPLKLDQTVYFESEVFRMLSNKDLPDSDNIGFMTVKGIQNILNYKNTNFSNFMQSLQINIQNITRLSNTESNLNRAVNYHGKTYSVLWDYLSNELGVQHKYEYSKVITFFNNCWYAPKKIVCGYLLFAKKAFRIFDDCPEDIRNLLFSDSRYDGILKGEGCMKKFGIPHYPFHPFIFERLICLYKYLIELSIDEDIKQTYLNLHQADLTPIRKGKPDQDVK